MSGTAARSPLSPVSIACTLIALVLTSSALAPARASAQLVVRAPSGPVQGVVGDGVEAFEGLRFAQPPVGPLRWRAPQPLAPASKLLVADRTGPACPQHPPRDWGGDPRQNEDCLYLNVWRPQGATAASRLPVMVWIYGGAFTIGDSASRIYDGSSLARDGVIVVNFNYRLGQLGWFALPELTREAGGAPTANFGLMDQIAALKWVRANISAFGGDPGDVTIFGESAGGMSVNLLMVSPAARGLFAKAITESGLGRSEAKPLAQAEAQGTAFERQTGAADLAALRALPVETMLKGAVGDVSSDLKPGPILDGRLIPENVDQAFAEGREAPVPWIVGSNDYEASLFHAMLDQPDKVLSDIPAEARPVMMQAFDPQRTGDKRAVAAGVITDFVFTEPARFLAQRQTRLGQPTYRYFFAYTPQAERASLPGAGHGSELPFVFNTLGTFHGSNQSFSAMDRRVAVDMGRYWTDFAKTGDPNGAGLAQWPTDRGDRVLVIDASGEHAVADLRKARLDLVAVRAAVH